MPFNAFTAKGLWDASANRPFLVPGRAESGDAYVVSVSGNIDLGQEGDWQAGDLAYFALDRWVRIGSPAKISGVVFATIEKLRLYRGPGTTASVVARAIFGDGGGGRFSVDAADSTSVDDGAMVIVDLLGRRWRREFYGARDPRWHGLKYDGSDTTAALQASIDALPASGGVIELSDVAVVSNLRLNGTLRNKSNVVLRGLGLGSGLRLKDNAGAVNFIDGEGAIGCRIENMTLDGNRANQVIPALVDGPDYERYSGVYLEAAVECAVVECKIVNMAVIGVCPGAPWIGKTGADRIRVERSAFENCRVPIAAMKQRSNVLSNNTIRGAGSDYGILLDEYSTGNEVVGNSIESAGSIGIFLFRASNNVVSYNRISGCLLSICLSDASSANVVEGNYCTNAGNSHIKLINSCNRNAIINNTLYTAAQYCIVCEAGTGGSINSVIASNRCRAASYSAIALFNGAWSLVQDNYCWEALGSGVYLSGACDWSEVVGNYLYNNSKGSVNDAGVRLVAQNNVLVEDNKCFDSEAVKTQVWGIRANEGAMGTYTILNNDVRFNLTAGMALSGTAIVKRNIGWVTEAAGNVTLGAAATSIVVNHGMDMTPNYRTVRVTGIGDFSSTRALQIDNVGATQFTILADAAPGGAGLQIAWEAKCAA